MEYGRDVVKFDQIIGEGRNQMLVERDLILPDINPDIAKILSVLGNVNITRQSVEQDRIGIEGTVDFEIIYTAKTQQPILIAHQEAEFSHYIDILGALPMMESDVKCRIEHTDFSKISGRKLNVKCVIDAEGKAIENTPLEFVSNIDSGRDTQVLEDSFTWDEPIGEYMEQSVLRGTIEIPQNLPPAVEILKCNGIIHKKETSIEEGKIIISGNVYLPILFSTEEENTDVCRASDDMVFTHTIELPEDAEDVFASCEYAINDLYTELKEDDAGEARLIDVEIVVGINAKAKKKCQHTIVVDAYNTASILEIEKKKLVIENTCFMDSAEVVVKEPIPASEMEKIYDLTCVPSITECRITEDMVDIEGILESHIIYKSRGEESGPECIIEEVPFKTQVKVPEIKPNMKCHACVDIEHIDSGIFTKKEPDMKILLGCKVLVYEIIEKELVVKMEEVEGELPIHKSSITIYVVQPKDTLWKIAKRYYTTVEDIVKINDITNPDLIVSGMKLIIPKAGKR